MSIIRAKKIIPFFFSLFENQAALCGLWISPTEGSIFNSDVKHLV